MSGATKELFENLHTFYETFVTPAALEVMNIGLNGPMMNIRRLTEGLPSSLFPPASGPEFVSPVNPPAAINLRDKLNIELLTSGRRLDDTADN